MIARILAIAGSDSGGGAGIQADIKTITALGGHAMTAVTAITAQNTLGVSDVAAVPVATILAQIDAVSADLGVDAIKTGMIGSPAAATAVAERLAAGPRVPHVFDPVMVASSGAMLADAATIEAFARLMAVATLVTPNAPELAALTGLSVRDEVEMAAAAIALSAQHGVAVLAKGGHLAGGSVIDLLVAGGRIAARWADPRIETRHSHGTGCTLSSAAATGLGQGLPLPAAISRARRYVRAAMAAAPGLGAGHGPMGHGLDQAFR